MGGLRFVRSGWILWVLGVGACSAKAPDEAARSLDPGVVARVGADAISRATVERVAAAQEIDLGEALERVVSDALFAQAATAQAGGADRLRRARRVALSRLMLRQISKEAKAEGAVTEEAISKRAGEEWWQYDRPELLRAVHAVVRFDEPEDAERARAVADRIFTAARDASNPEQFVSAARSVDDDGFEVRIEPLEPSALDGRVVDPAAPPERGTEPGRYSPEFTKALHAIERDFAPSPPFRSEFGYHVAMVTERFAERRPSDEDLRVRLEVEVLTDRTRDRYEKLVERLRGETRVDIERAAMELTKKVLAEP